jgi:hypothetical protein
MTISSGPGTGATTAGGGGPGATTTGWARAGDIEANADAPRASVRMAGGKFRIDIAVLLAFAHARRRFRHLTNVKRQSGVPVAQPHAQFPAIDVSPEQV